MQIECPLRFTPIAIVKAHQRPITAIESTGLYLISGGYDRLVKIFDIRTMRHLHTLIHDESPVLELKVDEEIDVRFFDNPASSFQIHFSFLLTQPPFATKNLIS